MKFVENFLCLLGFNYLISLGFEIYISMTQDGDSYDEKYMNFTKNLMARFHKE